MRTPIFFFILLVVSSCQNDQPEAPVFVHDVDTQQKPWLHENFDRSDDQFTFAIISDLNGGERTGIFEVAVKQLNLLRPELVLSVGDLIDGGTEDRAQLAKEWDSFDARASKIKAPFFHLGGNHDLTNRIMREFWAERYGPRYYHFIYKDVLFLMLDSEDFTEERMKEIYLARAEWIRLEDGGNPPPFETSDYYGMPERMTGEIGNDQATYFEEVIQRYPEVRWTFVLMHKPVWKREGEGNLSRIEKALGDRPYTVINGHYHTYSREVVNGRDYIMLGTTGGVQFATNPDSFDHLTLVTMDEHGPTMANLKMEGILDSEAIVPGRTDDMCFHAYECEQEGS